MKNKYLIAVSSIFFMMNTNIYSSENHKVLVLLMDKDQILLQSDSDNRWNTLNCPYGEGCFHNACALNLVQTFRYTTGVDITNICEVADARDIVHNSTVVYAAKIETNFFCRKPQPKNWQYFNVNQLPTDCDHQLTQELVSYVAQAYQTGKYNDISTHGKAPWEK